MTAERQRQRAAEVRGTAGRQFSFQRPKFPAMRCSYHHPARYHAFKAPWERRGVPARVATIASTLFRPLHAIYALFLFGSTVGIDETTASLC